MFLNRFFILLFAFFLVSCGGASGSSSSDSSASDPKAPADPNKDASLVQFKEISGSEFEKKFESKLDERKVKYVRMHDGRYEVFAAEGSKLVSLANIERNYLRNNNEEALNLFIDTLLQPNFKVPEWQVLKEGIYISLESNDYLYLDKVASRPLSDLSVMVLSYYDRKTNRISWLLRDDIAKIGVNEAEIWKKAQENLEIIISNSQVLFTEVEGEYIGMIEVEEPYKASLLLAKSLKQKVINKLGWPIYATAPSRDFVYLLSKKGKLINFVGQTVISEFQSSGYPLSTEVWELSDNKIQAIGEF